MKVLLENGFLEDSFILLRSNFESYFNLKYIVQKNSEQRAEIFDNFFRFSYLKALKDYSPEKFKKFKSEYNKLYEQRNNYKNFLISRGKSKLRNDSWSFLSLREMIKLSEIPDSIYTTQYFPWSSIVHGTDLSGYYKKIDEENIFVLNDSPHSLDINEKLQVIIGCSFYFLEAIKTLNDCLKLELDKRIKIYDEKLLKLFKIEKKKYLKLLKKI
ncbi:MAG: DUF5677 domain-containing protein [Candidatus Omnitrophica bacterium]|nr:DUF5677 domain-containing protein [Candidatus Omnitrophota bacterium]